MTETITGLHLSPLEVLTVLGSTALVLGRWLRSGARRTVRIVAAAVFLPAALWLLMSGLRWHMVPVLTVGAGALLSAAVARWRRHTGRPVWRARWWLAGPGSVTGLALIAVGPAAAWALPVPAFPQPSGPSAVGSRVLEWTDPDRPEAATADSADRRSLVVQLWYPANATAPHPPRAQYLGRTQSEARTVSDALAAYLGVPGFLLHNLPRARSHSVPDAAVAGGRFPVVLFSPGLGGVRTQNTAWAEELASHGYVVVGVDHPYDSAAVVFADGRTVHTRVAATGDQEEDQRRAVGWTAVRAADLSFVLTQLGRLDRGEIAGAFAGRLDTDRAAATGHSLGGAAALQAARQDRRFAAAIDLDGFPRDPEPQPFHQPVLAITHAVGGRDRDYLAELAEVLQHSTATSYRLTVPGTAHVTFTDAPLYLPPVPAVVGSVNRNDGLRITVATCAAFLDATLRGRPGDLPRLLSGYGELTVFRPDGNR